MAIFGIKENKSLVDVKAGAGISLGSDGATIGHSNSVAAKTTMIGSATAIPRIKYDAQGHITGTDTVTVYPPTDPGQSGQVWTSDGTGTGRWDNLDNKQDRITISTSNPSGGKDGDIWLVYE